MDWAISKLQLGLTLIMGVFTAYVVFLLLRDATTVWCIIGPCPQPGPRPSFIITVGIVGGLVTYLIEVFYNNRINRQNKNA